MKPRTPLLHHNHNSRNLLRIRTLTWWAIANLNFMLRVHWIEWNWTRPHMCLYMHCSFPLLPHPSNASHLWLTCYYRSHDIDDILLSGHFLRLVFTMTSAMGSMACFGLGFSILISATNFLKKNKFFQMRKFIIWNWAKIMVLIFKKCYHFVFLLFSFFSFWEKMAFAIVPSFWIQVLSEKNVCTANRKS